jgi:CHAT domain-containing protein/tetratricopeptide (TPR) repeat protein
MRRSIAILISTLALAAPPAFASQPTPSAPSAAVDSLAAEILELHSSGRHTEARERLEEAAEHYVALGESDPAYSTALSDLGTAVARAGDYAGGERLFREALALDRKHFGSDHERLIAPMTNLADALWRQGSFAEAEALYRETLALQRRIFGAGDPNVALGLLNLGKVLLEKHDNRGAESVLQEVLSLLRTSAAEPAYFSRDEGIATALLQLGAVKADLREFEDAERLYREALAMWRRISEGGGASPAPAPARPSSRGSRGALFRRANASTQAALMWLALLVGERRGDHASAEPLLREATDMVGRSAGKNHPLYATYLSNLAVNQGRQGKYALAEAYHREVLRIQRDALGESHPDVGTTLQELALVRIVATAYAEAESLLSESAEIFEKARLRALAGEYRARQRSPYRDLAACRLLMGDGAGAWAAAERFSARVLSELMAGSGTRDLALQATARADSLEEEIGRLQGELAALNEALEAGGSEDLRRARDDVDARLPASEAEWTTLRIEIEETGPEAVASYPLDRVQSHLDPETAIVGWLDFRPRPGEFLSWGYVIRETGSVSWIPLFDQAVDPDQAPPYEISAAFVGSVTRPAGSALRGRVTQETTEAAGRYWNIRFAPLESALDGVERLVVLPSDNTMGVPVEALGDGEGRLVGDRYAVSYMPSATVYARLKEFRPDGRPQPDRALLVGDPVFNEAQLLASAEIESNDDDAGGAFEPNLGLMRGALAGNRESLGQLWPLPWTRREVEAVGGLFAAPTTLSGRGATEQALQDLATSGGIGDFSVIHLATHALADDESPARSALALSRLDLPDPLDVALGGERMSDGLLTATEIVRDWGLNADLVTLSACETGLGRRIGGEGYIGLAHAFLQAGARSLLVSLWEVNDEATALLMQRFYQNWRGAYADARAGRRGEAMTKSAALQEAKRWLRTYRDDSGNAPYEHPYYWAGFILFGEDG